MAAAVEEAAGLLADLEANAHRVKRAVEDAWRGAELQEEVRSSQLEREVGGLKRELAKSAVELRALEREVVRVRAHAETLSRTKFEYLEEKLQAKEAQVLTLRKERNVLLTSLRQLQQEQVSDLPAHGAAEDEKETPQVQVLVGAQLREETPHPQSPAKLAAPRNCTTPRTDPGGRRMAVARANGSDADVASDMAGGGIGGPTKSASISPELLDELQALSQQLLSPVSC